MIFTYLAITGSKDTCILFESETSPVLLSVLESKTSLYWLSVNATATVKSSVKLSERFLSNSTMWMVAA